MMRKANRWVLLAIILIAYLLGFTNGFSEERGFLVTQDSNISEPYKYIGFLGSESKYNPLGYLQAHQSEFVNECINNLVSQAKASGADGIISLTWKFQPVGNNDAYVIHCEGMAIKRGSTH